MNASELALAMLEWEKLKHQLDDLGDKICEAVLGMEKTQTVGNVRASYSKGRRSFQYDQAIAALLDSQAILEQDLKPFMKVSYDYHAACEAFGIEDVPFTQGAPSVSLKLLEG